MSQNLSASKQALSERIQKYWQPYDGILLKCGRKLHNLTKQTDLSEGQIQITHIRVDKDLDKLLQFGDFTMNIASYGLVLLQPEEEQLKMQLKDFTESWQSKVGDFVCKYNDATFNTTQERFDALYEYFATFVSDGKNLVDAIKENADASSRSSNPTTTLKS